jgi:hypothetical protein
MNLPKAFGARLLVRMGPGRRAGKSRRVGSFPIMMTLPADEDYARAALTIFCGRRVRARQSLKSSFVKSEFLSHNFGRGADFEAAVDYAVSRGWITLELGSIRLTDAGFEEI